jgi:hypothetical protein
MIRGGPSRSKSALMVFRSVHQAREERLVKAIPMGKPESGRHEQARCIPIPAEVYQGNQR